MLRIAVCEDEPHLLEQLSGQVRAFCSAQNLAAQVAAYPSGERLLLAGMDSDIALLDIGLGGLSGVETARRMRAKGFAGVLVFVTSHRDYALDAFALGAVHYLVKPVEPQGLAEALVRALQRLGHRDGGGLVVALGNTRRTVLFRDILYCEVRDHKVFLQLKEERLEFYGKLEELCAQLDGRFFRCHRSFVVSLSAVRAVDADTAALVSGARVPVARRKRQELAAALLDWLQREEGA